MTTYTWPSITGANLRTFSPAAMRWGVRTNARTSTSSLSGATQTVSLPGSRWLVQLDFAQQTYAERAQLEALFMRLNGQEHRLALWDFARSTPRGTSNTGGVTVRVAAAQFATSLSLQGLGAGRTLLAGDWAAVATAAGNQLVQVSADATADASGYATVEVRAMLRGAASAGAAVTLVQPAGLFVLAQPDLQVPRGPSGFCPAFSVDLIEVFN